MRIDPSITIDNSSAGLTLGKLYWGAMPLPRNSALIGSVKRSDGREGACIHFLNSGVMAQGNAGVVTAIPYRA